MKIKSIISTTFAFLTVISFNANAATVELLTNGNFDSGPGAPWVEVGNPYPIIWDPMLNERPPYSESYLAWLGGVTDIQDSLSQTFIIPDQTTCIDLSFFWDIATEESPPHGHDTLEISIDGTILWLFDDKDADTGDGDWLAMHLSLSTSYFGPGAHTLTFASSNDDRWVTDFYLDNVSIQAYVVPVPATLWLLGSGLISFIGIAKRKRSLTKRCKIQ